MKKNKSTYQIHKEGISRDQEARQRVTFLMKTTIKELIKSKKYKQFVKDSTKEMGRAWWHFANITQRNHKTPWMWRFKEGEESHE